MKTALYFCLLLASPIFGAPLPSSLEEQIRLAAHRSSLDPLLVKAVIQVESAFRPKARSPKGAMGLMQVMPGTADQQEIPHPLHPMSNLMGACDYLRSLLNRYQGKLDLALAAYNAGPHAVDRYRGIPPYRETQAYVKKILSIYRRAKAKAFTRSSRQAFGPTRR